MKIGIGITSYKRPEHLELCLKAIELYTEKPYKLHIARDTDENRLGVAKRKNECLRALKECEHIFLYDDDCRPIKRGWVDFFVNSGYNHLLFLNNKLHKLKYQKDDLKCYYDCGGVFMYMTRGVIEKVGAFNESFEMWGLEHAEYSNRIVYPLDRNTYYMRVGTENYLYAEDYSNPLHKSSISNEEKNKYFKINFPKFKEKIKDIYIPL